MWHVTTVNMDEGEFLTLDITAESSSGRAITLTAQGTTLISGLAKNVTFAGIGPPAPITLSGTGTVSAAFVFEPGYNVVKSGTTQRMLDVRLRVSDGTNSSQEVVSITVNDVEPTDTPTPGVTPQPTPTASPTEAYPPTVTPSPPAILDADEDGVPDFDEISIYGTDPNKTDTDGDGMADADELALWGDAWNLDYDDDGVINLLDADNDNDGFTDLEEIALGGYDPFDPNNRPPVIKMWSFDEDAGFEGWTIHNVAGAAVAGGVLSGRAETEDPYVQLVDQSIDARYVKALAFRLMVDRETSCQVHVATRNDDDWSFKRVGDYALSTPSEFSTIVVPLGPGVLIFDVVSLIRIDPTIHPGAYFEIDWVRLIRSDVPAPTVTPSPTATRTPTVIPTPTFPTTLPHVFSAIGFEKPSVEENGFVQNAAVGFKAAAMRVGDVPAGTGTDGRGLVFEANPGEGTLAVLSAPVSVGSAPVLVSVWARAEGPDCSVALAALNAPIDGQLGYAVASGSDVPVGKWRQLLLLYDPPNPSVHPGVQVVVPGSASGPVKVYLDNLVVSQMPEFQYADVALDVNGTFDSGTEGLLQNVNGNSGRVIEAPEGDEGRHVILVITEENDAANIGVFASCLQGEFPHVLQASVGARRLFGSDGVTALVMTNGNGNVGVFVNNSGLSGSAQPLTSITIGGGFVSENPAFPILCVVQNGGPGVMSAVEIDNLKLQRITAGL
jgi:hypothetical protein